MNKLNSSPQTLHAVAKSIGDMLIEIANAIDKWLKELQEERRRAAHFHAYRLYGRSRIERQHAAGASQSKIIRIAAR